MLIRLHMLEDALGYGIPIVLYLDADHVKVEEVRNIANRECDLSSAIFAVRSRDAEIQCLWAC